jgi:hypothetical protein
MMSAFSGLVTNLLPGRRQSRVASRKAGRNDENGAACAPALQELL